MTEYPKDFGNGYKIQMVFANQTQDGGHGDIYNSLADVEREHPGAETLQGYCVININTGLVAAGCRDWNETIEAAVQDYEEHIIPILDRDEDIELNSTELDKESNPIRETLFSVKSGWLQDYLGVDNRAQLEAFLTNSTEWDPTEILEAARKEPGISGLSVGEVTEHGREGKEAEIYYLFENLVSLRDNPNYQIASDMAYMQEHIELDEQVLTPEPLFILASKLDKASGSWFTEPLLHQEYLDAIRYLIEYGINENHSPEFPELNREDTLKLLLTANNQVFGILVEVAAINNREHYNALNPYEDISMVASAVQAMRGNKKPLDRIIAAAKEKTSTQKAGQVHPQPER